MSQKEEYFLVESIIGDLILGNEGKIIDSELYELKPEKIASNILIKEKDEMPVSLKKLLDRLTDRSKNAIINVENEKIGKIIATNYKTFNIKISIGNKVFLNFRKNLDHYIEKLGLNISDYQKLLWQVSLALTRNKIKETAEKRDLFVAQAISALDETDKTINLYASRIREWYSLHFPELNDLLKDHKLYASFIFTIGKRNDLDADKLRSIDLKDSLIEKIINASKESMGAELSDFDLKIIKNIAETLLHLFELRKKLEDYINDAMEDVAPNVKGLVGSLLGARLIALAGGLKRLASLPASTIQVLGAEKALFRALRTGGKPPKHGVIFTYPEIFRASKWQRGKIARALAAKLAIAARIDAFTGEYKADILKDELNKRIEEIKTVYAKPPKKEKKKVHHKKRRKRKR